MDCIGFLRPYTQGFNPSPPIADRIQPTEERRQIVSERPQREFARRNPIPATTVQQHRSSTSPRQSTLTAPHWKVGVQANFGGGRPDVSTAFALGNPPISAGLTHTYGRGRDNPHPLGGHIGSGF